MDVIPAAHTVCHIRDGFVDSRLLQLFVTVTLSIPNYVDLPRYYCISNTSYVLF